MENALFHGDLVDSNRILYTPSPFAKTCLLHLQETGTLQARRLHASTRENLVSYLFFVVRSGSGTLEYEGNTYTLYPGDCVFLDCRRGYTHRTSDNLWQLTWVHFYGPLMNNIYEKYLERGGRVCFHPQNSMPFDLFLEKLYDLASSSDPIRDMCINELLTHLLTLLMAESWHPDDSYQTSKKRSLQNIKEHLDQHYQEKISLDQLAEQFYINKFYLTRIFREQYGVSINTYLLQIRITHAKQLLRFTTQTVESISRSCGMGDANYFCRMFKKVEGMSPGEFRKKWRA